MPMSPENAEAACARIVGCPAFSPKRPSIGRPASSDRTRFGRPLMPSPSASSGSASARMSASGTASSSPSPIICGATRGESCASGASGP